MLPSDLQFQNDGIPIASLRADGTLAGVQVLAVAALNGPGQGRLAIDAAGNLSWTPPDGAAGTAVNVSAGGTFLIAGSDPRQWLLVSVYAAYLALAAQAAVTLDEVYDSPLVYGDVTAAEAAAGNVQIWSIELANTGAADAGDVTVWLDPAVAGLLPNVGIEISWDGVDFGQPTSQATGIDLGPLPAGQTLEIYFRRTVLAGAPAAAACPVLLHASIAAPIAAEIGCRGLFRVFAPACYRLYRSQDTPPVPGSAPWATSPALPATPADTFADGTWYLAVSYFNGIYDSGFLPIGPRGESYLTLSVSGGSAAAAPPSPPQTLDLAESAAGVVKVTAVAARGSGSPPSQWYLSYTVNGGAPSVLTYRYSSGALAVLAATLPSQTPGSVVAVTLRTRRNDGTTETPFWTYSTPLSASITLAAGGPSAPIDAEAFPDQQSS